MTYVTLVKVPGNLKLSQLMKAYPYFSLTHETLETNQVVISIGRVVSPILKKTCCFFPQLGGNMNKPCKKPPMLELFGTQVLSKRQIFAPKHERLKLGEPCFQSKRFTQMVCPVLFGTKFLGFVFCQKRTNCKVNPRFQRVKKRVIYFTPVSRVSYFTPVNH